MKFDQSPTNTNRTIVPQFIGRIYTLITVHAHLYITSQRANVLANVEMELELDPGGGAGYGVVGWYTPSEMCPQIASNF